MFGPNTIRSGFTLTKIIGGLSRGLTIANQVIPLYQQAKPLIGNARKVMGILKEFSQTGNYSPKKTIEVPNPQEKKNIITNTPHVTHHPQFFQ